MPQSGAPPLSFTGLNTLMLIRCVCVDKVYANCIFRYQCNLMHFIQQEHQLGETKNVFIQNKKFYQQYYQLALTVHNPLDKIEV